MIAYLCRVKLNPEFFNQLLTVTFTLFAVIDIIGSIPLLHALKKKIGSLNEGKATLISGALMVLFLFGGEQFLKILGVDQRSFAVGGSIVIFILGLEMVLGIDLIERILGPAGMIATRKFFGVILLAIAVKIFSTNLRGLLK